MTLRQGIASTPPTTIIRAPQRFWFARIAIIGKNKRKTTWPMKMKSTALANSMNGAVAAAMESVRILKKKKTTNEKQIHPRLHMRLAHVLV